MELDNTNYATVTTVYTRRQRIASAGTWLVFGAILAVVLALCGLKDPSFFWGALLSVVLFGVIAFAVFMRASETALTPEALVQQRCDIMARQAKEWERWKPIEALVAKRFVRYPLSAALFGLGYYLSHNHPTKTMAIIVVFGLAILAAFDAILWLIGLAAAAWLGTMLFNGVAALPVSIAVIAGALIIAAAVKR